MASYTVNPDLDQAGLDTNPALSSDVIQLYRALDRKLRKISVGNLLTGNLTVSASAADALIPFVNGAGGPLTVSTALKYTGTVLYAPYMSVVTAVRIGDNNFLSNGLVTGCVFVGNAAGNFTLTGTFNVGVGQTSLIALTTGHDNVAVGANALKAVTTGVNNTAIGSGALQNSTGSSSVAIGHGALNTSTDSTSNVAIGQSAFLALLDTSDGHNVAIGVQAGYDWTTASGNILLGTDAGRGYNLTGNGRFIAGAYSWPITDVYFGSGEGPGDGSAPVDYTLHGAGANSADTDGADLILAGGRGCGTGKGGAIILQHAPAGSSGSTQNALAAGLPVFANNAAAVSGGLPVGALYRTNADPDPVCIVH